MNVNDASGYDALNFNGLERRGNYRFIAFREDILHALDKKEAAAIIFQIVYRWQVEYKRNEILKKIEERKKTGLKLFTPEEIEDMMFVYMSYNDFVRESGGALGYNTVIRTLKYLIEEKKVLIKRENHDPRFGDYEYSISKDIVRQLLKSLPVDPAFAPKMPKKKDSSTQMGTPTDGSTQMGTPTDGSIQMGTPTDGSTQMGTPAQGSTHLGTGSTQMGTEVYPNGSTSQELTGTHKNESTNAAISLPLFSLSDEELLAELHRRELERPSLPDTKRPPSKKRQRNTESLKPKSPEEAPAIEPSKKTIGEYSEAELKKLSEQELTTLLNPKEAEILGRWRSLFKAPIKLDGKLAHALHDLEPYDPSAETLENIRRYCYTTDRPTEKFPKGYYGTRGVKLWDVVEHFADWQQTQEVREPEKPNESKEEKKLTIADLTRRSLSSLARL